MSSLPAPSDSPLRNTPDTAAAHAPSAAPASEFTARLAHAENLNLRQRLTRLEASIGQWAADVDEAHAESAGLRRQIEGLRSELRGVREEHAATRAERKTLRESITLRDQHIAELETRILAEEIAQQEERRTRSRLVAIRQRMRARLVAQGHEIEGLRRMLALGHAARRQVEEELRELRTDLVRNEKYLDRLEERLRAAEAKGRARS